MEANAEDTYEFVNKIVGGSIPREYIPHVDKGFQEQMKEGVNIGQAVVGIKVEINDGSTHAVDSSEMAFKIAARAALRTAIRQAAPIVLEPIMKLEVSIPEEFQGPVIGGLNQRRGVILDTNMEHGYTTVLCEIPLKEMFGYSTDIRSATQGKGEFSMEFAKYLPVPKSIQEEIIKSYQEAQLEKA
jgi:elongation factor G